MNETNLMQRVVLVRHNSYLFKGTVEENLKMAKPDATKEEMEAVLQKVNLLGSYKHRMACRHSCWKSKQPVRRSVPETGDCQTHCFVQDSAVYTLR